MSLADIVLIQPYINIVYNTNLNDKEMIKQIRNDFLESTPQDFIDWVMSMQSDFKGYLSSRPGRPF